MRSIVVGVVTLGVSLLGSPAVAQPAAPAVEATAQVRPELTAAVREGGAPVSAIVVLDEAANLAPLNGNHDGVVAELKRVAARTQPRVRAALPSGVTVRGALWITNALVVDLPAGDAAGTLAALSRVPGVAELALNTSVRATGQQAPAPDVVTVGDRTWGIDRVQADRVWDELGVTGAGVRVAVLDTGVDLRHPDLAGRMVTDDPADPTYPGGWIWFDRNGNAGRTAPHDDDGHGTHVSGTIVGGARSGTAIGVAPGARLMHAQVLPDGEGTWAQVLGGMQWSIDPFTWQGEPAGAPADVVNMSVGVRGYLPETVPVTRAIRASGAFPAFSIGNECEPGQSSSPANVYDAFGVGATGRDETVPWWSCGGVVSRGDWADPPADWPATYVKPDVTAPGDGVLSSAPGGGYVTLSGTSMATPHVAGVAALMRSAVPGLPVDEASAALRDTAVFSEAHGADRPNPRLGAGRIDAFAAVRAVAGAGAVTGVVTDRDDRKPVAGATVTDPATGQATTTGTDGRFRLPAAAGRHTLTVSAPTYVDHTVEVTVPADGTATARVRLTGGPAGGLTGVVTFGGRGVPGATVTVLGGPTVLTDRDGRYTVDRLPPGAHRVRVAAAGLPDSDPVTVTVTDGATATRDLTLNPPVAIERASEGPDGADPDSSSGDLDLSGDARFVAFDSYASNLVAGDTNGRQDVFVRDRRGGTTELVSVASDGTQGDSFSSTPSISGDGRYVAFESYASNLVAGDTPFTSDVFLHDRENGTTVRISRTPSGAGANGMSTDPSISADGRYVVFSSWASDLVAGDTNGTTDVFVYDVAAGTLALVSVADDGHQGDDYSKEPDLSADGRYVAFVSRATNLVAGDDNRWMDVFVRDLEAGTTSLVSVGAGGAAGNHEAQEPSISGDGNVVAFHGLMSNLVAGDTNDTYDVFAHDRRTGRTVQVSVDATGEAGAGSSIDGAVSEDGRFVAFTSGATNLAGGDVNGVNDVFVRDLEAGTTSLVSAPADGAGADKASLRPVLDAGGRTVALYSAASNLVPGDGNRVADVFVVDRFPPPAPHARFVVSELSVDRAVVRAGDTVTVRARVTNIGSVGGDHDVPLTVDGVAVPARPVSLAPGAAVPVSWEVPAGAVGGHDVRVGPSVGSFRVRAPVIRVRASTLDERDPLRGAVVRFIAHGTARPGGTTGRDGSATVETQAAAGEYTVVVTRSSAKRGPGYLLVERVRVDRDVTLVLTPTTSEHGDDPAAMLDVSLDRVGDTHHAWTYLRHEATAPLGFAFPPGKVVATTGAYELRHVHVVAGFERDWVAVSDVRAAKFGRPKRYRLEFGGAARASLSTSVAESKLTATWTVTDSHGVPFSLMAHTPLRAAGTAEAPPPPAVHTLAGLPRAVLARASEPEEVILRVYDAGGTQVLGGGLGWDRRVATRDLTGWAAGTYRAELSVATGGYRPGSVTAAADLSVP